MRIAALQCAPRDQDIGAALAFLERQAVHAADSGARLLVTPEMYLTGYNIGAEQARALAETQDGPALRAAAEIAQRQNISLVFGFPELADDGTVYNAVQLINREGSPLATYRKAHLFGDVDRSQFSAGSALSAIHDLDGWRVGLAICYDIEFPELVRGLAVAGAEAVLCPTANMQPFESVPTRLVPARAEENAVFLTYANYCGSEGDFAYCGLSCICAPDGSDLARAGRDEEIIVADLTKETLTATRKIATHLRDRRPDLYGRILDQGDPE